ncbi:MAG: UvrD-helicase domain-containing protein [Clostridiales bacterium]|jgi:uncharacterized protein (TIGR00375 family)|nr:UvrD-helicase domain-containing protein [Clostridiales bacterium]
MFIADFHIHSRYSRATSKDLTPETLAFWGQRKGLGLIGTGDFTHAAWRAEISEKLAPAEEGLYRLKDPSDNGTRFIITGEISSIYKKNGKMRKVHNLIILPGLEAADKLSKKLETIGNLHSDGRPILGLDSRDLLEITLDACPNAIFIPAHIWTPHFSLFGAYSGFNAIEECFEDLTGCIHALETGLSSDIPMNGRLSTLDKYVLVSNSDAHSPANLAREANVLDADMSYTAVKTALSGGEGFYGTLEFFPEQGKYHFDGHRNCGVRQHPSVTAETGGVCPVCGKQVTIGVLNRVEQLSDRAEIINRRYEYLAPLTDVIRASTGRSAASKGGQAVYNNMLAHIGPELDILRIAPLEDIRRFGGELMAEGIRRLRAGEVTLDAGYDGEYGKVHILSESEISVLSGQISLSLSGDRTAGAKKKSLDQTAAKPKSKKEKAGTGKEPAQAPDAFNQEQSRAVQSERRAVMVIAGPGTGKTRTLAGHADYLINQMGVPPENVAAVTFTNRAARELSERLKQPQIIIGTFHSIALREIRLYKDVILLDEAAAAAVLSEALEESGVKVSGAEAAREISLIKNGAKQPKNEAINTLLKAYNAKLDSYNALDFDGVLLAALDLPPIKAEYLLVDEFQDINPVQYELIRHWSVKHLFAIGDPQQSIYGFRGSDPAGAAWFKRDFPDAENVFLRLNYRSVPAVVSCANWLLAQQNGLEPIQKAGLRVKFLHFQGSFAESVFIAKEINRMVGGLDMTDSWTDNNVRAFSDIAVLYRTHRQAELIGDCLTKEGIPFMVTGRGRFLTAPMPAKALAFFQFMINPDNAVAKLTCLSVTDKTRLPMLMEKYRPLLDSTPPAQLLEEWLKDVSLEADPQMGYLIGMALTHTRLKDFLNAALLGSEGDVSRVNGKSYSGGAVTLSTIHAAKGLEYPAVFVCGAVNGLIPQKNSSDITEEKRLLYVGVTRAREELIITAGGEISEFLKGIEKEKFVDNRINGQKADRTGDTYVQTSLL